ncbi:lipoprotein, putative [Pseudooceanicola batsensis HTCC2597]|uniref:Lipoprotein, putative n=1 Tax=Pseudooceanicola batsensis (strain ATCC BAA-863 / DSM 15984 / KCTC 12145 / HTCC2597) TaxID=252305 RepID=A3TXS9_PSEBH|nr:ABC-type transport auxiliary lipoprotein family protein [Pseudooceanicola batsensis]EAQ02963.1 lipoprotein, putative [Pseudooceanicola batsensis HTCC2597]
MILRPALLLVLVATLSACGGTVERYATGAPVVEEELPRISSRYRTVEVRQMSLPTYAASEEIATRDETGAIVSDKTTLWADEPARAMTLELSRYLGTITGAQVAAEPWPFLDRASVIIDVRVEEMVADADGAFRISGQYYVAPDSGNGGRSGLFSLAEPIRGEGASAIAAARTAVTKDLAEQITRSGLR